MNGSDVSLFVDAGWEHSLANRRVLSLDPAGRIAIKRDVHQLVISADVAEFAESFHRTMRVPGSQFGLLQVLRPAERTGQPFALGDRFQGRFNLPAALQRASKDGPLARPLGRLARSRRGQRWLHRIGDGQASDYGMIDLLQLDGDGRERPFCFRYRYLEGSPIAGSSTFTVSHAGEGRCRLVQAFEFQERDVSTAAFFSVFGLKLHNQVVYSQTLAAAEAIGARVVETDIPVEYLHVL